MSNNRALLVTGASSDVGCELIRRVWKKYDVIYAHYFRTDEKLKCLQESVGDRLRLVQADFTNMDDVYRMIGEIQQSEIPISNIVHLSAPKVYNIKFAKCDWLSFQNEMQSAVYAISEIIKAFIPSMSKQKYGRIIFMLTAYTQNIPPKYLSPYITSKYASLGLMKCLSAEYSDKGITVNGVSPEMIETKFLSELPSFVVEKNALDSPLGRNLTVQDVVPVFEYLLSDAAEAVTGQNLAVTGGR